MNLFARHKQLLPVLILSIMSFWTAVRILFSSSVVGNAITTYNFTSGHYFGFLALAICFFLYFVFRKAYKFALGATLVLGLFSIVTFTLSEHVFGLRIGALAIVFEPFSLLILLLVLVLDRKRISQLIRKNLPAQTASTIQDEYENDLVKYKAQYRNSSIEELQKVVNDARFKPGAIEAAKQLLKERE